MTSAPQSDRPFVARLFESTAIKSWNDAEAPKLRRAMVTALDDLRDGKPLVLDVLVDLEAVVLEPKLERSTVLLWRSRPSTSLGARVRRSLGFYSGESRLAAAVLLENGAALDAFLPDTALWDAEFTIYPQPDFDLGELPDPHFEVPGFASRIAWTLSQDASHEPWLVTAQTEQSLELVFETLKRAFVQQQLTSTTSAAPDKVYGER
jgi:hypothetical protein